MRVMGIDPGYDRVGWAVLELDQRKQQSVIGYGCIQTNKTETFVNRYQRIATDLQTILQLHQPAEVAIESVFFSKNQKTALRVSEARGVVIATLLPFISALAEYTPNQIKQVVTGYGKADKAAVDKMVRLQLKLPTDKIVDDAIDAIAIAFTHTFLRNTPS